MWVSQDERQLDENYEEIILNFAKRWIKEIKEEYTLEQIKTKKFVMGITIDYPAPE